MPHKVAFFAADSALVQILLGKPITRVAAENLIELEVEASFISKSRFQTHNL